MSIIEKKDFAFIDGPGMVRYSRALKELKKSGSPGNAADFEKDKELHGSFCDKHGKLHDPAIGLLEGRVAFICPWCSGPTVLAAWEAQA